MHVKTFTRRSQVYFVGVFSKAKVVKHIVNRMVRTFQPMRSIVVVKTDIKILRKPKTTLCLLVNICQVVGGAIAVAAYGLDG